MKSILLTTIAVVGISIPAALAEYTVFRVCEEERVFKTSDGADAGHVEYIVVDPAEQRIVSAVLTGGVIANKRVAVPMSAIRVGGGREVVLTEITRERLVSAPVIEATQITEITRSSVIQPTLIERSTTYFSG